MTEPAAPESLRLRLRHIIFGTNTPAGRLFDQLLIITIIASVIAVMLDSVQHIHDRYGDILYALEWGFTVIFTLEYLVRLWISDRPGRYAFSFYGIVDLLSVLPTYISLVAPGANYLLTIRILRVLRIFRVMRLLSFMSEANFLAQALVRARRKIGVFLFTVLIVMISFGSLMYVIEGPANGFTSIPRSIYWAIVTVTTVGYGDITPHTVIGQAIAALAMITGYAIIAVPTGIVTAELSSAMHQDRFRRECTNCHLHEHEKDAHYCKRCGEKLPALDEHR
ncbi:MAG: ion transporter [Alcanivoracaceae bacterium]|nr:ion transporter [Alcanivoracaceae bacterium]